MQLKSVIEVFVKTSATFKFKTATNFKIFLIKMLFINKHLTSVNEEFVKTSATSSVEEGKTTRSGFLPGWGPSSWKC